MHKQISEIGLFIVASRYDHGFDTHARRTGWLAERLCISSGLPTSQAKRIADAVQFHDLGKRFIPDSILDKPGALTSQERSVVEQHAGLGARYLQMIANRFPIDLDLETTIADSHHERWDGLGYPKGLSGLSIPFAARIAAVADVFDALASERPYKQAWPLVAVFEYIKRAGGRQFDPLCVRALERCANEISSSWPDGVRQSRSPTASKWSNYVNTYIVEHLLTATDPSNTLV